MQLIEPASTPANLRCKLSAAIFTVLSATQAQGATPQDNTTDVDAAVLFYRESGGRITTTEAVVQVKQVVDERNTVGLHLTFDSLSGGSPNGALPSKTWQTFARPSGSSLVTSTPTQPQTYTTASGQVVTVKPGGASAPYAVAPGDLPLDDSFHDQRLAANFDWTGLLTPVTSLTLGGNFSHELDFQSLAASATLAQDFNEKNTTLTAGVNLESDWIKPIGGAPVPMSDYGLFKKNGSQTKRVQDVLLGVSQVMTRRWITQFNWSLDKSNGYQNDPYKILSALDTSGNTVGYVYENRPNDRSRNSFYWGNKIALDHDTVAFSVRHMTDDWGIKSNTIDARYRWTYDKTSYLEPQVRFYQQSAANFYQLYLLQGAPLVSHASADPRLAKFTGNTFGLKWGFKLDRDTEFSARVQVYNQNGHAPSVVPAGLQGLDLYPGLKSQLVQIGLKTQF